MHLNRLATAACGPCCRLRFDSRVRFYKGLRWFKKDSEPVVIIPGHNQHHRYTSPVIFDAFSGSLYEHRRIA
jgi:hypothetical protein